MPGAFVAGLNGVKAIFQAVGAGQPLAWTGFTMALVVLCLFTIVFGRFFCGWVCAFGALGLFLFIATLIPPLHAYLRKVFFF